VKLEPKPEEPAPQEAPAEVGEDNAADEP